MPLLDHSGSAVPTTLVAGITSGDTSASINSSTGWPSGGANGPFYITIDRGLSNEERIKVTSRTGGTLSSLVRGVDGTAATSHAAGASVEHTFSGEEIDDLNAFVNGTGVVTSTHLAAGSVTAGKIAAGGVSAANQFGTGVVDAAAIAADAVGSSELADGAVDTNAIQNLAVTAAKIANGTITTTQISGTAAITGAQLAAAAGIVGTQLANDTVTATQIAANAVTASELADNAVDAAAIAANAVVAGKVAAGGVSATNQLTDAIVTLAKTGGVSATDYSSSVTFTNPTGNFVLGGGGEKTAFYIKLFGWNLMLVSFTLGTAGNITAGGAIEVSLPVANNANFRGFCAARARSSATSTPWSGTGVIAKSATVAVNWATAADSNNWDATHPFNWDAGDSFDGVLIWYSGT